MCARDGSDAEAATGVAFSVRQVFRGQNDGRQYYEERITLWRCDTFKDAIAAAEIEAEEYAAVLDVEFTGLSQAYRFDEDPRDDGAEVFSLLRYSEVEPDDYLDHFFDTGAENGTNLEED